MGNNINDLKDISAEAGIIATLVHHPDYVFHSDSLKPNYFFDNQNGLIYYSIQELAKMGIEKIDAYNITMILNKSKYTENDTKSITVENLNSLIEMSDIICRNTVEEYMILCNNVTDQAFRRQMFDQLKVCENLVFDKDVGDIQQEVFSKIDKTISSYSGFDKIVLFRDKVDDLWKDIEDRHKNGGLCGLPSKIGAISEYFTYEKTELILVCAFAKTGKSILAMNEVVDKLRKGYKVVHIDTEMCDRQNMERMLSHIAQVPVKLIKDGKYNSEQAARIQEALNSLKEGTYIHEYMPSPDLNKIYSILKRMKANNEVDFVVYDYLKSQNSNSSSEIYNMLGDMCNFLKNRIAGELELPVLALAQLNRGGDIADSFKLEQFASTVAVLRKKTTDECDRDGVDCGNYKFFVKLNRLGSQMSDINEEYIDLSFDGNTATIEEAPKQHTIETSDAPF